jgi:hypothetical protein
MCEHEYIFQRAVRVARERRTRAVKAAKAALDSDIREVNGLPCLELVGGQPSGAVPSGTDTWAVRQAIERAWDRYHTRIAAIWAIYETEVQKAQAMLDAANAGLVQQDQHVPKKPKAIATPIISTPIFRKPKGIWPLWRVPQLKRLFN